MFRSFLFESRFGGWLLRQVERWLKLAVVPVEFASSIGAKIRD